MSHNVFVGLVVRNEFYISTQYEEHSPGERLDDTVKSPDIKDDGFLGFGSNYSSVNQQVSLNTNLSSGSHGDSNGIDNHQSGSIGYGQRSPTLPGAINNYNEGQPSLPTVGPPQVGSHDTVAF